MTSAWWRGVSQRGLKGRTSPEPSPISTRLWLSTPRSLPAMQNKSHAQSKLGKNRDALRHAPPTRLPGSVPRLRPRTGRPRADARPPGEREGRGSGGRGGGHSSGTNPPRTRTSLPAFTLNSTRSARVRGPKRSACSLRHFGTASRTRVYRDGQGSGPDPRHAGLQADPRGREVAPPGSRPPRLSLDTAKIPLPQLGSSHLLVNSGTSAFVSRGVAFCSVAMCRRAASWDTSGQDLSQVLIRPTRPTRPTHCTVRSATPRVHQRPRRPRSRLTQTISIHLYTIGTARPLSSEFLSFLR